MAQTKNNVKWLDYYDNIDWIKHFLNFACNFLSLWMSDSICSKSETDMKILVEMERIIWISANYVQDEINTTHVSYWVTFIHQSQDTHSSIWFNSMHSRHHMWHTSIWIIIRVWERWAILQLIQFQVVFMSVLIVHPKVQYRLKYT